MTDNLLFKTKFSLLGIVLVGLLCIPVTYVTITNQFEFNTLLGFIALIAFAFPQFIASPKIEFYSSHFFITYPLLSFLPAYKKKRINYSDIKRVYYAYKIREPHRLEIILKNNTKIWFWYRFRCLTNDKKKATEIINENVEFQFKRFNQVKRINDKKWRKINKNDRTTTNIGHLANSTKNENNSNK